MKKCSTSSLTDSSASGGTFLTRTYHKSQHIRSLATSSHFVYCLNFKPRDREESYSELVRSTSSWCNKLEPHVSNCLIFFHQHITSPDGKCICHYYMSPKPVKAKKKNQDTVAQKHKRLWNGKSLTHLIEYSGILETDSLSMSLEVTFLSCLAISSVLFVQLTGTRTAQASTAIGVKILSLRI